MQFLFGMIIGGLLVAYWRDKKFREWVNTNIFKSRKPQDK